MQNDQTTQDAKRLLVAFSTNHSEARMVSPYGRRSESVTQGEARRPDRSLRMS